ncbi:MAG: hypothetical protein KDD69_12370 [Bdellovibrionales bacterium]|nr:hypothetical protein [Bdellovibrionales bacterium]
MGSRSALKSFVPRCVLTCACLFYGFSFGATGALLPEAFAQEESEEPAAQPADEDTFSPQATPTPELELAYSSGYLFGHLLYLDPKQRFVFLKPIERASSRKTVYLDRRTIVSAHEADGDDLKRVKAAWGDLVEGQKVAIRFIAKGDLHAADEIFIVKGEFDPDLYKPQRRKRKRK